MGSCFYIAVFISVVCASGIAKDNCHQLFNLLQLRKKDVSLSDGGKFNDKNDLVEGVYCGTQKTAYPTKADYSNLGDNSVFPGD